MQAAKLKNLTTRKQDAEHAISVAREEISRLDIEVQQAEQKIIALKDQKAAEERTIAIKQSEVAQLAKALDLRSKKPTKIVISEHAMVRYMERVIGYTPEDMRKQILPKTVEAMALSSGDGEYNVNGTHTLKIKDGVVVTLLSSR